MRYAVTIKKNINPYYALYRIKYVHYAVPSGSAPPGLDQQPPLPPHTSASPTHPAHTAPPPSRQSNSHASHTYTPKSLLQPHQLKQKVYHYTGPYRLHPYRGGYIPIGAVTSLSGGCIPIGAVMSLCGRLHTRSSAVPADASHHRAMGAVTPLYGGGYILRALTN